MAEGNSAPEFEPITSQDDLNRIISERVQRERGKYADYADLKAKATKFDNIEQANQSEAEKSQKRISDLEAELAGERQGALRLRIAAAHGIADADDVALFLTGSDEETLTRQAKRLSDRADRKSSGNYVPREGRTPAPAPASEEREFLRGLFGG